MDQIYDEEVADLLSRVLLYQNPQVIGVTRRHRVPAIVVNHALDTFIAPDCGCGGRCQAEIRGGRIMDWSSAKKGAPIRHGSSARIRCYSGRMPNGLGIVGVLPECLPICGELPRPGGGGVCASNYESSGSASAASVAMPAGEGISCSRAITGEGNTAKKSVSAKTFMLKTIRSRWCSKTPASGNPRTHKRTLLVM